MIKTQHCPNCEATEQKLHDFRQEVSDIVEAYVNATSVDDWKKLKTLLIPKPDPLVEVLTDTFGASLIAAADRIEQLEREKAVVSDLWEQQKQIALDYLADCNKAADHIEAQADALKIARDALDGMAQYSGMRESWQNDNPQYVTAVYEAIDVINAALEQSK